jgi:hypothetical protein
LVKWVPENEWEKTEQAPIPLPSASRNFPDVKTRNKNVFYNWTSEITPFIHFVKQMDRTWNLEMSKVAPFIVIQLSYNELWPFSHKKWSKIENLDNLVFGFFQRFFQK